MADLQLDYLAEAKACLGAYVEDADPTPGGNPRTVRDAIAFSLLSIADSLHRIVEDEVAG